MSDTRVIKLSREFSNLNFLPDRRPDSNPAQLAGAFAELGGYRDGAIFIGHYAGNSEWERHRQGDEIVSVLEGETRLTLLQNGAEEAHRLEAGELLVVPRNTWHRFETDVGVKIMTVTPQPTDHSIEKPHS